MNQHNGLRRKLEKYAIPNLTLYLIICYGIGYLMQYLVPAGYQYLMLDPFLVLKGQVWRLVTWILIPPDSSNIFLCADHAVSVLFAGRSVGAHLGNIQI